MERANSNEKSMEIQTDQSDALSDSNLDLVVGGGNGNNGTGHGKAHQRGSKAEEERSQTYYGRLRTGL